MEDTEIGSGNTTPGMRIRKLDFVESSTSIENCHEMDEIAKSTSLRAVLFIHTICSIIALPLLVFLFRWTLTRTLMHFNTKIIIIFNIICLFIHLLARIHQHVIKLLDIFSSYTSGCEILPSSIYCFYIRLPYNCGLWLCYSTTIVLSIERCVATKFLHHYFNNRIVGPLLICAQIVVSAVLLVFVYIPVKLHGVVTYYCMAMSCSKPLFTVVPLSISMIIQTIGIILFTRLKGINKEIKTKLRTTGDVRGRYQVEETLRSLDTLSPFFYSSYTFIFTYLALMCLTMTLGTKFSEPIFFAVIEGTNWMPQFCMFLPLLLWYRSKNFTNKIKNLLTSEIATTTERYEEELRKMWL